MSELTGKIYIAGKTMQVSEKFSKRAFVVEIEDPQNPQYNQFIECELHQDKCNLLDGINIGDHVLVKINLRGRKYTPQGSSEEKFFNTIVAWQIVRLGAVQQGGAPFAGSNNEAY